MTKKHNVTLHWLNSKIDDATQKLIDLVLSSKGQLTTTVKYEAERAKELMGIRDTYEKEINK